MAIIPELPNPVVDLEAIRRPALPAAEPPQAVVFRPKLSDNVAGVGEYVVSSGGGYLVCIGLGSCVGIGIWDPYHKIGGLAHAMLPRFESGRDKANPSKYADAAVFLMIDELVEMGASKSLMRAKMAGGAQMFQFASNDMLNIGQKNAEAAREALKKENVPLLAEDCGGNKGRTVTFYPVDGVYRVQIGSTTSEI